MLIVLIFVSACTAAIYFYVQQMKNMFLKNNIFAVNEPVANDINGSGCKFKTGEAAVVLTICYCKKTYVDCGRR